MIVSSSSVPITSTTGTITIKRVISCFLLCRSNNNNNNNNNNDRYSSPPTIISQQIPKNTPVTKCNTKKHDLRLSTNHNYDYDDNTTNTNNDDITIAVFHRVATMPTYPDHWAACSGSMESYDSSPFDTCQRELFEETNLRDIILLHHHHHHKQNQCDDDNTVLVDLRPIFSCTEGLYVDVSLNSNNNDDINNNNYSNNHRPNNQKIIRVYPFAIEIPHTIRDQIELRGTEHDKMKWISLDELTTSLQPTVPKLQQAFHHATRGRYLTNLPPNVQQWASDKVNGASIMAQNAIQIITNDDDINTVDPTTIRMLRPSMVAITNTMNALLTTQTPNDVLQSLQEATTRATEFAVNKIRSDLQTRSKTISDHKLFSSESSSDKNPLTIVLFSRSGTVKQIINQLLSEFDSSLHIICCKSTPGDEGVLMLQDLIVPATSSRYVECRDDDDVIKMLQNKEDQSIDMIVTGCDCITEQDVVNKLGTRRLLLAASQRDNNKPIIYCCANIWKVWNDIYPPPLEDIFECIPKTLYDEILIPPT